jgi:hypothetical protein
MPKSIGLFTDQRFPARELALGRKFHLKPDPFRRKHHPKPSPPGLVPGSVDGHGFKSVG